MSRRNQTRRRRSYGRRQHEVRERRPDDQPAGSWLGDSDTELETEWQSSDAGDDRSAYESFGSYGQ